MTASMLSVKERLLSILPDIVRLEDFIEDNDEDEEEEAIMTINELKECLDKIESMTAFVHKVNEWAESAQPKIDDEEQLLVHKEIIETAELFLNRLEDLDIDVNIKKEALAEEKKNVGNEEFKKGKYLVALALYEEAININPNNAIYYTNRALVYQKIDNWEDALCDAQSAVDLDADLLKGHIILIKCQIKLELLLELANSCDTVPVALQKRPELMEQKGIAGNVAKDIGNAFLKAGDVDDAIQYYTLAVRLDGTNHVLYSNRSAAFQQKKLWTEAAIDAAEVIRLNPSFAKGHIHLGRSLVQLHKYPEAFNCVATATSVLSACGQLAGVQSQLNDIQSQITAGVANAKRRATPIETPAVVAEKLKTQGNNSYKAKDYKGAVRYYSQAIGMMPTEGAFYGNRAAGWIMLKEFKKAVDDCVTGLKLEKTFGELDKLRQRHASALAHLGKIDAAVEILESITAPASSSSASSSSKMMEEDDEDEDSDDEESEDDEEDGSPVDVRSEADLKVFQEQLKGLKTVQSNLLLAAEALLKREFSRAKRLLVLAQTGGASEDSSLRLLMAKAHLGLGEMDESSKEAQKVIAHCDANKSDVNCGSLLFDAYVVRGEALSGLGSTEQAVKYLAAALQLDPDNNEVVNKYKTLKKIIAETTRIRSEIDKASNARLYDVAVAFCSEGLLIDKDSKKLTVEMHLKRAKVYKLLAKQQLRQAQAAPSSSSSSKAETVAPVVSSEEYQLQVAASWKSCLRDSTSAMYYDTFTIDGISGCVLKLEALQGLDRYEEAVSECEQHMAAIRGKGLDGEELKAKLKEAQVMLKKSKRVNLYSLLGVVKGPLATEKEIKAAYKKMALKYHPDRHSCSTEEKKKEAETKFKEIGDVYEILTDATKKRLWDQGYDRDELDQRAAQEASGDDVYLDRDW
eukprot:CAMPEP_0119048518 /NCGR_PEP_ID=MMETSP1177-20130426/59348_1 /TAXON_ID=2985 /ORGANISM="Ochromonas sp, Strain CCMP1899" /LENGTH=914 /DNA_ID=CAMNT_0007024513 /DNA_START=168 /DNA_END=2909 /DNA_ORIENTATION=-